MSRSPDSGTNPGLLCCCPRHSDREQVADHLLARFPQVVPADVRDELEKTRVAMTHFGLAAGEELELREQITRNNLMRTGQIPEAARLDPEKHFARMQAPP